MSVPKKEYFSTTTASPGGPSGMQMAQAPGITRVVVVKRQGQREVDDPQSAYCAGVQAEIYGGRVGRSDDLLGQRGFVIHLV